MRFYLTKTEEVVLYKKYKEKGLTSVEANDNIKKIKDHLKKLVIELERNYKSDVEINKRFTDEFHKICMELEN